MGNATDAQHKLADLSHAITMLESHTDISPPAATTLGAASNLAYVLAHLHPPHHRKRKKRHPASAEGGRRATACRPATVVNRPVKQRSTPIPTETDAVAVKRDLGSDPLLVAQQRVDLALLGQEGGAGLSMAAELSADSIGIRRKLVP